MYLLPLILKSFTISENYIFVRLININLIIFETNGYLRFGCEVDLLNNFFHSVKKIHL